MKALVDWKTIQKDFTDGVLILGNGASIAVWEKFKYSNLRQEAKLDSHTNSLFDMLKTDNFEKVLEHLYITYLTNRALKLNYRKQKKYHKKLRQRLLDVLGVIHPEYRDVQSTLDDILKFINDFQIVVSLNYDLLFYWANIRNPDDKMFRDFFGTEGLIDVALTESYKNNKIVLYPHGGLFICKSMKSTRLSKSDQIVYEKREFKLRCSNDQKDYNRNASILDILRTNVFFDPIFVSEGVTNEKKDRIQESEYLGHIFHYLKKIKYRRSDSFRKVITIFGFSFCANDQHIFDQMAAGVEDGGYAFDSVAVSVYNDDPVVQGMAIEALTKSNVVSEENIIFFNSATCNWPQR